MPVNHGLYRKLPSKDGPHAADRKLRADQAPVFRYGFRRVSYALANGAFLAAPDELALARQLDVHFTKVCSRFVYSLQELNRSMQRIVGIYRRNGNLLRTGSELQSAECSADHVLTYLNILVDDVAMVTATALGLKPKRPIDSMGALKSVNRETERALDPIGALLDELDVPHSWWDLGFKPKKGLRQLLVHNQHLVNFQLSRDPDGPIEIRGFVNTPYFTSPHSTKYFDLLGRLLSGLFDWMDRLQETLSQHLKNRSGDQKQLAGTSSIHLPVGLRFGTTKYMADYFPIPLCTGADPLPWSINVGSTPQGTLLTSRLGR